MIRWQVDLTWPVRLAFDLVLPDPPPAIVGLIGPNGAGKTTLLRHWAGIGGAVRGRAAWHQAPRPADWRLVWVPQAPSLWPHRRLDAQLAWVLGRPWHQDPEVAQWVERLGLGPHLHRFPPELSGGLGQRATLVRALAAHPTVLALDEVLSQVDAGERERIWEGLEDWAQARPGRLVVITSHRFEEVRRYCDYVVVLAEGTAWAGTPDALRLKPHVWAVGQEVGYAGFLPDSVAEGAAPSETPALIGSAGSTQWGMALDESVLHWQPPGPARAVMARVRALRPPWAVELELPTTLGRRRMWLPWPPWPPPPPGATVTVWANGPRVASGRPAVPEIPKDPNP
ncbi:MAG: ATP-binding cassette domain-containing protein [Firmicutes bacterium]|nr:ATP-binding cassette domain-containing protein [Alicyclobacillaceae bacterium]MCL6497814.1 ATP-binding cassette domain-containing protein [Bacillota bacterium]